MPDQPEPFDPADFRKYKSGQPEFDPAEYQKFKQPEQQESLGTKLGRGTDAVVGLGKMAYSGYNQLADKFSDPSSPLYDEAVAGTLRALPGAVGVPESRLGLGLAALGGVSELGATKGATSAVESVGRRAASKTFQMGGLPKAQAEGASKNLEQIASPEDINVLRNTYNTIMSKFGIQSLEDTIKATGSKYPSATGDLQAAVNEYAGKKGADILANPETATLQDLHNVVDATSKRLFKPWAFSGSEGATPEKANMMKDLYAMKQDAMDLMTQKGQERVANLEAALSPKALAGLEPEQANALKEAGPRLLADAKADAEALKQVGNIRKQMFLSKVSSKLNSFTPVNQNGSMNLLGTSLQLGGAAEALGSIASGHPTAGAIGAVVAGAKSPIVGKGLVLGTRGLYNATPEADQLSQLFNATEENK